MDYNCRVRKTVFFIAVFALVASGCGLNLASPDMGTPTVFIITATLPPTTPPPATQTAQPPTAALTPAPIEGTTSTKVNVRGEPSTLGATLGIIDPSVKVQITGKDLSENWYQIVFAQAPDGKGWVTAQYVEVKAKDEVPVIGGAPASTSGAGSGSSSGPSGVVIQQVNVRSGPGTDFNALGTLNPKDAVTLTGKDANGVWLQIAFANGPDGKGWVTAAYVQANGAENLPIIAGSGEVVGTGTPTSIPPTITPTLVAALQDGDSAQAPAVNVIFAPTGTRSIIYSSDVSAPNGDAEDWIQFTPYNAGVSASLTCAGNGTLSVELWQNNAPLQNWGGLSCGESKVLEVNAGQSYLMRLVAHSVSGGLEYTHYTLNLSTTR